MGLRFYQTEMKTSSEELSSYALKNAHPRKRSRRKALPKAPPFPLSKKAHRAIAILWDPQARRDPQADAPYPARTATAVYSCFCFSAADPAVCCSCRLDSGPLLAADCCLETTASHSTTPSGFLGTQAKRLYKQVHCAFFKSLLTCHGRDYGKSKCPNNS